MTQIRESELERNADIRHSSAGWNLELRMWTDLLSEKYRSRVLIGVTVMVLQRQYASRFHYKPAFIEINRMDGRKCSYLLRAFTDAIYRP